MEGWERALAASEREQRRCDWFNDRHESVEGELADRTKKRLQDARQNHPHQSVGVEFTSDPNSPDPFYFWRKTQAERADHTKFCRQCKRPLPYSAFHRVEGSRVETGQVCDECLNAAKAVASDGFWERMRSGNVSRDRALSSQAPGLGA